MLIRTFMLIFLLTASLAAQSTRDLTVEEMQAEQRVALVIGNGAYSDAPLRNPVNDAESMAAALSACGFRVTKKLNCTAQEMDEAIRTFGREIQRGGVGLFYYAGHGIQVEGQNYLVPVGVDVQAEDEVQFKCINAGQVLGKMEQAGNRINIVILDACRNNPFARSFRSSLRGLAQMDAATGSLLAYATAPGSTAEDGEGQNGLYTSMLLQYLQEPGLQVEDIFKNVRVEVMAATGRKQVPWESTSLVGDFYFVIPETIAPGKLEGLPGQGKLYVDSEPRGARIFVDEAEQAVLTPATLEVGSGSHHLFLEKEELAWAGEVRIQRDRLTQVREALSLSTGSLIVTTNPPEVEVYLDGKLRGRSPVQLDQVSATLHRLRLAGDWVVDQEQEVQVVRNQTTGIDVVLDLAGFIAVESEPAGAVVALNDAPLGQTPNTVKVRPGEHKVTLTAEDYDPLEKRVGVEAGKTVALREELLYRYGNLEVDTRPSGARVALSGSEGSGPAPMVFKKKSVRSGDIHETSVEVRLLESGSGWSGLAPVVFKKVPAGGYTLQVTLENYQDLVQPVTIARGERTELLSLTLNPTLEYLQGRRAHSRAITRRFSLGFFVLGAASGAGAYWLDRQAKNVYDQADAAYAQYRQTTITSEARGLRYDADAWDIDGDDKMKKSRIAAEISAGLAGLSLVLFVISF